MRLWQQLACPLNRSENRKKKMIAQFITRFDAKKDDLQAQFESSPPGEYSDIVKAVIEIITDEESYGFNPSPNRIHVIDDGDYQGTLVFVIAAYGYQPDNYWYVKVGYGSCGGCDTLQHIHDYAEGGGKTRQYMTLATHVLQGLKRMGDDDQQGPFA